MSVAAAPIDVLVVDDSPTARAVLSDLCRRDPAMRVVGEAADGMEGVELAVRLRPTVILMDITMPRLDGYEATRRIMTEAPTRIVMVTAANDPRSVAVTLRALEAGALTVLAKPVWSADLHDQPDSSDFIARVKLLADVGVIRRHPPRQRARPQTVLRSPGDCPPGVVAVATSTGGPQALEGLLQALPADFLLPVVVVQHIVEGFVPGLAAWLNAKVALLVKVAVDRERLEPSTVYLAPDGYHLTVTRRCTIALDSGPAINGFRPSGSALLTSAAEAYGAEAIAVVLTGMGKDGLEGATAVSEAGGDVLAQDEETSVVFGMPRAVAAAGLADLVGPVESLARRLVHLTSRRMP